MILKIQKAVFGLIKISILTITKLVNFNSVILKQGFI